MLISLNLELKYSPKNSINLFKYNSLKGVKTRFIGPGISIGIKA